MTNPITPSIGRVVLVRHPEWDGDAPAIVTRVHTDDCVSVCVMPFNSTPWPLTSITYDDGQGDTAPAVSWHWMDYQLTMAAECNAITGEASPEADEPTS